jgi:hypothetical protein
MSWLDGDWGQPFRIGEAIEKEWWQLLERNRKGVYRLIALRSKSNLSPARLSRVCGIDETGTLYIGASDASLFNRVGGLVMTHHHEYKSNPHRPLSPRLAKRFREDKLAVSWEYTDAPYDREQRLLVAYESVFGELPPANNQRSIFEILAPEPPPSAPL